MNVANTGNTVAGNTRFIFPLIALSATAGLLTLVLMSLLTVAWSFCASVCVMLGSIHLLFWFRMRSSPVYLLSSLMAFCAGIHTPLVDAGVIATPYMVSFAFLAIIVSMSYQLAEDAMRSAQYARELQQSQQAVERLARANLLGELTSTLAHELNQPLSAILSNAQAGRRLLVSGPAILADIGDILDDIVRDDQRAADIIQRLRNLLQAGEAVREPLDINAVLQEAIALLSGELSQQQVTPTLEFGKDLPDVLAGRTEIQQVVINLIINALNALRGTPVDQRRLVIRTTRHNDTVMVTVRDTGRGIAEEDLPRIFEAFFTRKSDGLGMGLAIARRIIEAYGGRILAESTPA